MEGVTLTREQLEEELRLSRERQERRDLALRRPALPLPSLPRKHPWKEIALKSDVR